MAEYENEKMTPQGLMVGLIPEPAPEPAPAPAPEKKVKGGKGSERK